MSYFDNANTNVTRKSFGSKVDKTFQREGVIPVKNRKKEEIDYVAESARFNELNKKVESRRLNELKESRAYNIALNEGYDKLKDSLIKDFMSQICVESLLIDEEVVNNNLRNIVSLVEEQVDDLGGFNGIKQIAESTNNPLLQNMINVCEEVCKNVGKRNIKEANGEAKKLSFELNKDEMNDFDYRKQAMGVDTIVDNIKDKVFQVVQDEQKMNSDKQEVMNEIEGKIQELEAPVQEAMDFIFGNKIEETTLFDSLMRSHYNQIIESNCSSIFESDDDDDDDEFENKEFNMSEIDLNEEKCSDDEDEIEELDDDVEDEIENLYLEESIQKRARKASDKKIEKMIAKNEALLEKVKRRLKEETDDQIIYELKEDVKIINAELKVLRNELKHRDKQNAIKTNFYAKESGEVINALYNSSSYDLEEVLESCLENIKNEIYGCKTKSLAESYKSSIRELQLICEEATKEDRVDYDPNKLINKFRKAILSINDAKALERRIEHDTKLLEKIDDEIKDLSESKARNIIRTLSSSALFLFVRIQFIPAVFSPKITTKTQTKKQLMRFRKTLAVCIQIAKDRLEELKEQENGVKESYMTSRSVSETFALMEARCGKKKMVESNEDKEIAPSVNDTVEEGNLLCPYCESDPCVCDEIVTEGLTLNAFRDKMKTFFEDLLSRKLAKRDFTKIRPQYLEIISVTDRIEDCDALEKDLEEGIQQLEKAKHKYPEAKDKLQEQIDWLNKTARVKIKAKRKELEKKQVVESFITKLDDVCESLTNIIEAHETAYNNVVESLTYEVENTTTLVPYLQTKDCNLSNLEFAYKTKLVCESLKDGLRNVANEGEAMVIERAIKLNLTSINESLEAIKDIEKMNYKSNILESGKVYLSKLQHVINNNVFPNSVTESTSIFNSVEDVDRIFESVKEYAVIESTNNKLMELVMAEAIVEYTIMEAFNTLKLTNYDKDTVKGISRRNINK